jgi:hypothetical protein
MKKNVARLYISVHDIRFGQKLKGLQKIIEKVHGFLFAETTLVFDLLLKCTSIAIFVDKVVIVCCFENFNEAYYVSCVLNFREGLYFVDSELLEFGTGFKFFDFDDFDCYCLIGLFVDCSVNFSELSLTDDVI